MWWEIHVSMFHVAWQCDGQYILACLVGDHSDIDLVLLFRLRIHLTVFLGIAPITCSGSRTGVFQLDARSYFTA